MKSVFFIYECTRILIIAFYVSFSGINQSGFPLIFLASPTVLFPLMALFLWLDSSRYRVYLPLFAAGKCIGIVSLLLSMVLFGHLAMLSGILILELIILSCDILALAAILFIIKSEQKTTETPVVEVD